MSERRAIQPIAPAGESQRVAKPFEDAKPLKVPEPQPPRPRVERLSMSKQWVLPPRPKPGRKPKAAAEKAAKARPVPATHRSRDGSAAGSAARTPVKAETKDDDDGESCGLCSREDGCVCEEIGIRQPSSAAASPAVVSPPAAPASADRRKSSISLPSLDMILNHSTIKMDAVPIKRNGSAAAGRPGAGGTPMSKFKRALTFEPMQPLPVMSIPSPLESMHMNLESGSGCGFCSENTVCVCADTAASVSVPTPAPAGSPHSQPSPATVAQTTPPQPQHQQQQQRSVQLPPPRGADEASSVQLDDDVYGCSECERGPMSMLFCVSLSAARQLAPGAVAIPCNLAFKTLQKHHNFDGCDLGKLVRRLECSKKMVGVQSINRVLQEMERNEFAPRL